MATYMSVLKEPMMNLVFESDSAILEEMDEEILASFEPDDKDSADEKDIRT